MSSNMEHYSRLTTKIIEACTTKPNSQSLNINIELDQILHILNRSYKDSTYDNMGFEYLSRYDITEKCGLILANIENFHTNKIVQIPVYKVKEKEHNIFHIISFTKEASTSLEDAIIEINPNKWNSQLKNITTINSTNYQRTH